ncbi:hypothetical protein [Jiangella alkaliphila]|uniref:Uncharacterized protein n=1 Tax=Jiangella alkaliphila TaxID=419479 RepID=A0A1H2LYH2_9ACTN|nr:hypothetical protein [Jiangella alkaliphila]SDU86053.1 hypothetical protein SAMN04488563_6845 [Jiangella alkaliphila]
MGDAEDAPGERLVAAVRDDVGARLALAAEFYARRRGIRTYGRAQLAFMRWQARRGVLEPAGSPWWRAVNEGLLRHAFEAAALLDAGRSADAGRPAVAPWVRFLERPSPSRWYRAHNGSIVAGYFEHRELAAGEHEVERFFMDVALLRVFFAHALVAAPRTALGRFWPAATVLGDPRRRGTGWFLSLRNILPDWYPLDDLTIDEVLRGENRFGRHVDYGVIVPRLDRLYAFAAAELGDPRIVGLLRGGGPCYAWPADRDEVWRPVGWTVRLVGRITG